MSSDEMDAESIVLRADDSRRGVLEADGWRVVARSWGAHLDADMVDHARLAGLVQRVFDAVTVREIVPADIPAVLGLDAATLADYPGGVATRHEPLTREQAEPTLSRRAFGAFGPDGALVAMTYVDVAGVRAETDFTVVASGWRGRGLGAAVKAASVLTVIADGARMLRTGGSSDNAASMAANRSVGYVIDEEWLTMVPPARTPSAVVLINGIPGAGKTTLAPQLAAELGWPLVGKDMLKEAFGDMLGVPVAKTTMLGALASDTMWALAALVDGPAIVESFWRSDRDQEFLRRGLEVANAGTVVEVWCTVPIEVAQQRFMTRARHPIHDDSMRLHEWLSYAESAGPCSGHPVIEVETVGSVDIAALAARIKTELDAQA